MTLEEAKAQYKRALSSLLYSCGLGDLNAIEDSVKTLDAAVRDGWLATVEEALSPIHPNSRHQQRRDHMKAEIKRVFDAKKERA